MTIDHLIGPGDALERDNSKHGLTQTRAAIAKAYRQPEPVCVPPLITEARLNAEAATKVKALAERLVRRLRAEKTSAFGVEALMKEFSLSSHEGVALMCLAESLLRIPDRENRDRLIRDKLARADWRSHVGASPSLFVNAAAWGLLITGKLVATNSEQGLLSSLTRVVARGGEPVIRKALDLAMRLLGQKFVTGQTIDEALKTARPIEARGFRYSFDMLGEAAMTESDAARYLASYETAIHAIGRANRGKSVYDAAGISVKLSALHPRYSYAQMDRVMGELYPRLLGLAQLASGYGIGFNIDAEEADRLEPSLDIIEALAAEPSLKDWQGLGFVVQAYQKRAPFVINHLVELARATGRRLMIRLVKGAYWDSEIKRAQVDGLSGYPVYTRKTYTDVCYLACAKRLLANRCTVFPQFATHNAQTLSALYILAGPNFSMGDYEFQCLHGMGEGLYGHVVGRENLDRPCRIYAPVGDHETLLAYLVRRLLENGANSSFVHQLVDENVSVESLAADPVEEAAAPHGLPHPRIALPEEVFGTARKNSSGLDLSDSAIRGRLEAAIAASRRTAFKAEPLLASPAALTQAEKPILNPSDHGDIVGSVVEAGSAQAAAAMHDAVMGAGPWSAMPPKERAAVLDRAGDLLEGALERLCAILVREAGKTMANAIGEVREAVDFCRYYAEQVRVGFEHAKPLGPVVCISPWNFPLAIFTGQIAAALAAGNPVLAKPAEQTPLIAFEAVKLMHEAGVPRAALQFLPGDGAEVGAKLVAHENTKAVVFTGSTEVARLIQRSLATRGDVPLIAETGGQNAMIADSTALPEQTVADILTSAFDSAGQRCSALRVLCVQDEIADRILTMLKGGMHELRLGNPELISTDIGPVIDEEARANLVAYIEGRRERVLFQLPIPPTCQDGTFVPPTLIEISSLAELTREVFGPILHVLRFKLDALEALVAEINATGYGLTMGIHSRIDDTIDFVVARAHAGNIYVNRNMVGAVVGVQPFGGEGLSGTGPKAGGPLYVRRLCQDAAWPFAASAARGASDGLLAGLSAWVAESAIGLLKPEEVPALVTLLASYRDKPLPESIALPGPVGEDNRLGILPRGRIFATADTFADAINQLGAALATGNELYAERTHTWVTLAEALPALLRAQIMWVSDWRLMGLDAVLASTESIGAAMRERSAERDGAIVPVVMGRPGFDLDRLLKERTISINTTAAGGNASLMALEK